ncbi:MAG: DUF4139 domain-containing protein [Planctomycetes bacterium]|nr:DUF4139 domain-containing protein [Planctomycetota bacterium]
MRPAPIECESRIEHVTVHARGALVRRRVSLPATLPRDPVELSIAGVTSLAEPGSARALVEGGREVVGLRTRYVLPGDPAGPGETLERLHSLELDCAALEAERAHVGERRNTLAALRPSVRVPPRWRQADPAERARDAVAVCGLLTRLVAELDARGLDLDARLEQNARDLDAARLAAAQAPAAARAGEGRPTSCFEVRLAAGDAPVRSLELEYAVAAARWWPAYAVRLSEGASRAAWTLEALLAQDSGEDWTGVRFSFSTADLVHDARLPELPSLRLGRSQPAPRRGYRPAPEGLDGLFEAFDRALAGAPRPVAPPPMPASFGAGSLVDRRSVEHERNKTRAHRSVKRAARPPRAAENDDAVEEIFYEDSVLSSGTIESGPEPDAATLSAPGYAGGSPPPPPPPPAPQPMAKAAGAARAPLRAAPAAAAPRVPGGYGGGGSLGGSPEGRPADPHETSAPEEVEPDEAWLDFDGLVLPPPGDRGRRGRLGHDERPSFAQAARAARAAVDGLASPAHASDPLGSRGRFDHRYDGASTSDVPSDARPHRVPVAAAAGQGAPRFRVVPREAAEVYREVELRNPFDAPLLAGPVEVFVDGTLSATSAVEAVDRGGTLLLGLGVEDRLRVSRNVRADEAAAGLLGGSTVVTHRVTIDLTSALGAPARVEVIDRVPVTNDKEVVVEDEPAQPPGQRYEQEERGRPVEGGRRWFIDVPAGGKARIDFGYRITLPAKSELVGGNRRD